MTVTGSLDSSFLVGDRSEFHFHGLFLNVLFVQEDGLTLLVGETS